MIKLIQHNPLVSYFTLAIILSWSVYIPLVFVRQGWTDSHIPYSIHYLASFGPALAAFLMTASAAGRDFIPIVTSMGVIAWAIYVANVTQPWGFRFQHKYIL